MSDDYLIRARGLTKTYRMHKRPAARLANLFAREKPAGDAAPGEVYHALRGIDLEIKRGEKVAVIGRNGAGKSTLLKIITGVIKPTTGDIDVRGKSHALLSLGAGFHPDFTGRENAEAFLAHMGVSGKRAQEYVSDAVAFAEIEEHIDQPLKTYSTGMQARLMFAVSTALNPELLVIDEVLGVGDAYFQNKSFERIREMCANGNTTLILVSHDIYSAVKLCPRVIWVDKGRVLIDSDPATVLRAYEDSVREQEERRLRQKALGLSGNRRARTERVILEIQSANNQAPASPVWFSEISLNVNGTRVSSLRLGDDGFENIDGARLQAEGTNWSAPETIDGHLARSLRTHGAPYHKVAGVFEVADPGGGLATADVSASIEFSTDTPADLHVTLVTADGERSLGNLPRESGKWTRHIARPADANAAPAGPGPADPALDWQSWTPVQDNLQADISGDELQLVWNGPAGPYLMTSSPLIAAPMQSRLVPVTYTIESGTLGIGALDPGGNWTRTYDLTAHTGSDVLDFPTGTSGELKLVLYSAGPAPLKARVALGRSAKPAKGASVNTTGVHGAGDIRMDAFRVYGKDGQETYVLDLAAPARFEIDYRIVRQGLREKAQILLAFQRDGVQDVMRVIQKDILFDHATAPTGTLSIEFDSLPLAPGSYSIPVVIGAEGYFDKKQDLYFAINPGAYFVQSSVVEIKVDGTSPVYEGTGVVATARWDIAPSEAVQRPPAKVRSIP